MGNLAKNVLTFLEWPIKELEEKAKIEHEHSKLKYNLYPLDDQVIDTLNPKVNIYLTGDNTFQPDPELTSKILISQKANRLQLEYLLNQYKKYYQNNTSTGMIKSTSSLFITISEMLKGADKKVNSLMKRTMNNMINKKVKGLTKK